MKLKSLPVLGITTLLVGSLSIASTPTANGEFNLDSLNDQVQSHEARLGAVEQKVDATQAQVEQNAVTIRAVVAPQTAPSEPVAPVVAPAVTEASTPAPPAPTITATSPHGPGRERWTHDPLQVHLLRRLSGYKDFRWRG